jgi:hypothetical protein
VGAKVVHHPLEFQGVLTLLPKIDGMDVEAEKGLPAGKGEEIDEIGFAGGEIEFSPLAEPGNVSDTSAGGGGQYAVVDSSAPEIGARVVVIPFQQKGVGVSETRLLEAKKMKIPFLFQLVEKMPILSGVPPLVDVPAQESEAGRKSGEDLCRFV